MLSVVLGMVLAAVAPEVTDTSPKVTVNGYASVIVHKITNATASFDPLKDELAVGMAMVVVTPERFSSPWMRGGQ